MFVIYCRYSKQHDFIFNLVESIRKFHPEEKIVVYDSNSEDISYIYPLFLQYGNIWIEEGNNHYGDSALWNAYNSFPNEQFFYLFQDSMIVKQNLDYLKEKDFTSFMHFDYPEKYDSIEQKEYCKSQIEKTELTWCDDYVGLFGITFYCKRSVLTELKNKGLDKCLPISKIEMQGSERVWGIALKNIEIDITKDTICGDYFNPNPEGKKIIEKKFVGRA